MLCPYSTVKTCNVCGKERVYCYRCNYVKGCDCVLGKSITWTPTIWKTYR